VTSRSFARGARLRPTRPRIPTLALLLSLVAPALAGCAATRYVPLEAAVPPANAVGEAHTRVRIVGYRAQAEESVIQRSGYVEAVGADSLRFVSTRSKLVWWTLLIPPFPFVFANARTTEPVDSLLVSRGEVSTLVVPQHRALRKIAIHVAVIGAIVGLVALAGGFEGGLGW
jgi:hypothetical protein